jgi:hypothetical protein
MLWLSFFVHLHIFIKISSHIQTQLSNVHQEQHQDTAERIQELSRLMLSVLDPEAEVSSQPTRDLEVPSEICERFESALTRNRQSESMETSSSAGFPLRDGLEAFFHHFNLVRRHLLLSISSSKLSHRLHKT